MIGVARYGRRLWESHRSGCGYGVCWRIEAGRAAITPLYVTAFAHLLGYHPGDMVALTGVGPVVQDAKVHPDSSEIAALAWHGRHLTSEQLSTLTAAARDMLHR